MYMYFRTCPQKRKSSHKMATFKWQSNRHFNGTDYGIYREKETVELNECGFPSSEWMQVWFKSTASDIAAAIKKIPSVQLNACGPSGRTLMHVAAGLDDEAAVVRYCRPKVYPAPTCRWIRREVVLHRCASCRCSPHISPFPFFHISFPFFLLPFPSLPSAGDRPGTVDAPFVHARGPNVEYAR